jgi:hypothetical protein
MSIDAVIDTELEKFKSDNKVLPKVFEGYIERSDEDYFNFIERLKGYVPSRILNKYTERFYKVKEEKEKYQGRLFEV